MDAKTLGIMVISRIRGLDSMIILLGKNSRGEKSEKVKFKTELKSNTKVEKQIIKKKTLQVQY